MASLASILAPVSFQEFLDQYWGRACLYQSGDAARYDGLISWPVLSDALRNHPWQHPEIRLFTEGSPVPPEEFLARASTSANTTNWLADTAAVERILRNQGLLAWSGANDRFAPLRRLAAEFEYWLRERVQINIYSAYADSRGFTEHWDDHDVFVLQVVGRKRWKVWEPSVEAPLFHGEGNEGRPGALVWEGELSAGDLLYMPRGYWHAAKGTGEEPTIHLSVGVDRVTGFDLWRYLEKRLHESAAFRTDLPRFGTAEEKREHARRLQAELAALFADDVVEEFLRHDERHAGAMRFGGLSGTGDCLLRWIAPRASEVRLEEVFARFVEFDGLGKTWSLPRWTEPVTRLLAKEREIARADVAGRVPEMRAEDVEQAIEYLLEEGVIEEIPAQS